MSELIKQDSVRWDFDKGFRVHGLGRPFPREISFGDIDSEATPEGGFHNDGFEVEISRQFLVIEGKYDDQRLSTGQQWTMDNRTQTGRTCLIVYGDPPYGVHEMQLWGGERNPATLQDFFNFCYEWSEWAASNPGEAVVNSFVQRRLDAEVARRSVPPLPDGFRYHQKREGGLIATFINGPDREFLAVATAPTAARSMELATINALRTWNLRLEIAANREIERAIFGEAF